MKNKNGFSLVELIAVIIILSVMLLIAVPSVTKLIARNKEKSYKAKMDVILKQVKEYALDDDTFLYGSTKKYDGYICNTITVGQLKTLGYLEELDQEDGSKTNITDPRTNTSMENTVVMVYIRTSSIDPNSRYIGNIISTTSNVSKCGKPSDIFTYTGREETFTAEIAGNYKIEAWGAKGGDASEGYNGGYGAYAYGEIYLSQNTVLYINVGGEGQSTNKANEAVYGGYNGGGISSTGDNECTSFKSGSGGGASSVATSSGLLKELSANPSSVIIVAAGGGGAYYCRAAYRGEAGSAGGITGGNGTERSDTNACYGKGGTQTAGGCRYNSSYQTNTVCSSFGAANLPGSSLPSTGGGGGFYGGGPGLRGGAGGGSSYIGNANLTNKGMYCYNCTESSEEATKTTSTTCVENVPTKNCAKKGPGYVKITYLGA